MIIGKNVINVIRNLDISPIISFFHIKMEQSLLFDYQIL